MGSNGDEFNSVKNVKSTIIRLTEINDQRRMKKKLHKKDIKKKTKIAKIENIEKILKELKLRIRLIRMYLINIISMEKKVQIQIMDFLDLN